MAAYMRGMMYFVSIDRNAFLIRRSPIIEESKRYLRGLRRKPVRVLFPESDTGKVVKTTPQPQAAERNVKREKKKVEEASFAAEQPEQSGFVKAKSNEQSATRRAAAIKDQIDGLRFERAFPGDKRLA